MSMVHNTLTHEDKIKPFKSFNRARRFAKKNGVDTVVTTIDNYLMSGYNMIAAKSRKVSRKMGLKVTMRKIESPYSFNYKV